jgi:hypothetical protein
VNEPQIIMLHVHTYRNSLRQNCHINLRSSQSYVDNIIEIAIISSILDLYRRDELSSGNCGHTDLLAQQCYRHRRLYYQSYTSKILEICCIYCYISALFG